ncbi:hypothetical protein F5Y05DRAFT_422804 [Hypoxylon sp. FL0543]|nr:hypothetical protein F5Y05DRAFT_422804 [Hypoxylon sp. FL0543]
MCQVITQTNHSCGHQVRRYMRKSKYCLFFKHKDEDFHMVSFVYKGDSKFICEHCEIKAEAYEKGLRGAKRHEYIRIEFEKSNENSKAEKARNAIAAAEKSQKNVDPAKIAELNKHARRQVKWYLMNRCANLNEKALLLKTIMQAPAAIDRKALVECFGSNAVYNHKAKVWKGLSSGDRNVLTSIARRAGMTRALENGFKMENPVDMQ